MAVQGDADRLRADAAGAVEHALGRVAELAADEPVEHLALGAHRRPPVDVERVVVVRELVVERLRVHPRYSSPTLESGRTCWPTAPPTGRPSIAIVRPRSSVRAMRPRSARPTYGLCWWR